MRRQQVEKALMAPNIARSRKKAPADVAGPDARGAGRIAPQVETNCDYVGERFAEEARKIHYGEVDPHGIYGEATAEESQELAEEGIEFGRIPWVPTTDA